MTTASSDEIWMREAIIEAQKAEAMAEVPIGAVAVVNDVIIARAHNQNILLKDPTAHAEMVVITEAAAALQSERLREAELYVTIEPCAMCAGALVLARVKRIVYGVCDPKAGACGSVINVADHKKLNHRIPTTSGILKKECRAIIQEFFRKKRQKEN